MKVFVSRTFRNSEKRQVEAAKYFTELASEAGLEPILVNPKGGQIVLDQVLAEMKTCRAYLGIFTKRDKLESSSSWTIPSSVLIEMAMARVLNLQIVGFIDEEISRDQLGIIGMEGWQILGFYNETMYQPRKRKEFIRYLSNLRKESPMPSNPFRFLRFVKEVEIRPDGYAVITHYCRLKVLSKDFKQFVHMFTLSSNAGRDVQLPSFDELSKATLQAYWKSEPFFKFRLLDPISPDISKSSIKVTPTENCNDQTIEFALKLDEPIDDVILNYEWVIGCLDLFPTTFSELTTKGSRKKDEDSCFSYLRLGHGPIDDFTYKLIFFGNPDFISPPVLKIYDGAGNLMSFGGSFDLQKKATKYIFHSKSINTELLTSGRIVAEWIPE